MSSLEEIADFADVPVEVEVELGRRIMTIAQILELGSGQRDPHGAVGGRQHGHPGGRIADRLRRNRDYRGLGGRDESRISAWRNEIGLMDIVRQSLAITFVFALLWTALWLLRKKGQDPHRFREKSRTMRITRIARKAGS